MSELPQPPPPKVGWGHPPLAAKWHYFIGGIAICKERWFYFGRLAQEDDEHPQNCRVCVEKLRQRKERNG